jgi:HSP20 family protein|tara:strand:- start:164 stop:604 length:441 start_codon:yes stop_codon:yes gene_type:complete
MIDRDSFLTPFDKMFDTMLETQFPDVVKSVGVKPYQGSAYPKVNVYEYDDKVGIIAEIPGLDKKQLEVSVEEGVLTIAGDKHSAFENDGAKVLRRELKQSSFKRQFELGEQLDGENISANFKDGILSVSVPKVEPKKPKKHTVKIG